MRLSAVMVSSWRAGKLSSDETGREPQHLGQSLFPLDVHLDVTLRAKIHDLHLAGSCLAGIAGRGGWPAPTAARRPYAPVLVDQCIGVALGALPTAHCVVCASADPIFLTYRIPVTYRCRF